MTRPVIFFLITVVLLGAVAYWWFNRNSTGKDTPLTAEEARRLVRLAAEANACLENENFRDGFDLAEERFKQLKEKLPESLFVYRNQVIARILLFRKNKDEYSENQAYIDETTALIEKLIEKESDSFEPYILAVRWRYELTSDITEADIELLESAIANAGSNPVPYYEFYDRTSILDDRDIPGIVEKQQKYLAKAYELQPDNIKLSMQYLQQLAEQKSEQFSKVWKEFNDRLSPLIVSADLELFETSQREYVAKINAALKSNDWAQILLGVRRLSNLVKRGEVQKIDLARVSPYELEFLRTELAKDVIDKANPESNKLEAVPVSFESVNKIQSDKEFKAVKLVDFDVDNKFEIAALHGDEFLVYKEAEDGKWVVVSRTPVTKDYTGFVAADLDYDLQVFTPKDEQDASSFNSTYSDPDFILYGPGGVAVFENKLDSEGKRSLQPVQPGDLAKSISVSAATLVDIDHDKDLDLLVAGDDGFKLFLSRGNLSFYDFTEHSVFPDPESKVVSLDIVDLDRDIDIDILVGFENANPGYLENLGHSQLRFRKFDESFDGINECRQCFAVEMDGRPSWDLLCRSSDAVLVANTATTQSSFNETSTTSVPVDNSSILTVADFNNDGYLDCLCGGGAASQVVLGNGVAISDEPSKLETALSVADSADLNGDGKVDVVGISTDRKSIEVWANKTETDNQWIEIAVAGRDSNFPKGRINNHAVGSFVELMVGDYYFATTIKRPQLHFGLGKNKDVDIVRFLWTSGMPQSLFKIKSGQSIYEAMFEKGSCPYIYTWDGEKFTFFSDCLWAAPLGLQYAPGKFIPCRNWEYLKIPGEILQPKQGKYVLQITEELREAAYFDLIKLYAIDHPEDVEIFTNEKVGPPFIAEHKIYTVQNARSPIAAKDMYGNDVLGKVSAKDGDYFRGFKDRIGKGLAPLHYLELDFGDLKEELASLSSDQKMILFLNGWIRPTDCSLNISYAQNPDEPSPQTPVVLVPNEQGNWIKSIDPMGFPGGKPKTIAVDLTKAFKCDDYRIRIQTSHEIYWDHVFFTLGEQPAELRQTELVPAGADLHYRGFSKRFTDGPNSPEIYDYQSVNQTPRWPAMTGKFTRFGDVSPLILEADDRSVVIGAGDEMTVSFEAIPDPPAGWKRDFVIHLVGYDKDGDLNTVTGQSSEPLPFRAMKSYPWGVDEEFPSTPLHREYLQKYQTRTQNWGSFWRRVVPTDSQ